jgi:hypothetical protein
MQLVQKGIPFDNVNFAIDKLRSVLIQDYRSDITLVPPRSPAHVFKLFSDQSHAEGPRSWRSVRITWPTSR